ncbi:MAG: hypothetical protein UX04_C0005G0006 [Microgenomates group bacterium GW2011_GWF2_45_18]|nr:MAG: hypothetical protein UW18_C0007G0006 [Microgenomates group bacterium GW2011_GWF1_44_10]KKU01587.1 MAG: hypothetical protein UX04_C0005G0006 [Microgenomates group bacterium GW2011_GWF2_45_18]OGJ41332.1 MAG: hypothetical protein A2378_03580 [Candidatus Pacebacteria bacterium RIFOXYB1_FULL_44_10]HAU99532.1 hypothetical protein [Candidatus Paceibacterota bacterium]HAX01626.1 hypothetical protein [Candidatus Paceibacterota bacterium]
MESNTQIVELPVVQERMATFQDAEKLVLFLETQNMREVQSKMAPGKPFLAEKLALRCTMTEEEKQKLLLTRPKIHFERFPKEGLDASAYTGEPIEVVTLKDVLMVLQNLATPALRISYLNHVFRLLERNQFIARLKVAPPTLSFFRWTHGEDAFGQKEGVWQPEVGEKTDTRISFWRVQNLDHKISIDQWKSEGKKFFVRSIDELCELGDIWCDKSDLDSVELHYHSSN